MDDFAGFIREEAQFKIMGLENAAASLRDAFDEPDIFVNETELQIESPTRGVTMWFTKDSNGVRQWCAMNSADGVIFKANNAYDVFSDASILF